MAGDVGGLSYTDSELLLHPELLSQEFLLLTLEQVRPAGVRGPAWERCSDRSPPQIASVVADTPAAVAPRAGFTPLLPSQTHRPGLPTPPSGKEMSLTYQKFLGVRTYLLGSCWLGKRSPKRRPRPVCEQGPEQKGREES